MMRRKCKSKCRLAVKKPAKKRESSRKSKRSRRKSHAHSEKRRTIMDHLKRKEAVKQFKRHNHLGSISDDSYEVDSQLDSSSESPKFKRTHFKRMTLDSSVKGDSYEKLSTQKVSFKTEYNKAQEELTDLRNQIYELQFNLENKDNELVEAKKEASMLKKKMKHYKYYKDKTKQYKNKLKQASKDLQGLEIQNNRK